MASVSNKAIGRLVRLSRGRQQRDPQTGHERELWFDERAADRTVKFFSLLRHSKGEWAGLQQNM